MNLIANVLTDKHQLVAHWVAYFFQGGVGVRVSNGFWAICLPTYLAGRAAQGLSWLPGLPTYLTPLESRGYHFTIYMSHQI